MKIIKTSQRGFVLLPLIIAVAVVAVVSGGTALYQTQKTQQAENKQLQEVENLQERMSERANDTPSTPTDRPAQFTPPLARQLTGQEIKKIRDDLEKRGRLHSSISEVTQNDGAPTVASSSVSSSSVNNPKSPKPDVPAIVEEQFKSVFGRMPTASESEKYKKLYREKGYTKSGLLRVMFSDAGEERMKNLREKYGIDNSQSKELRKIRRETLQKYIDDYKTGKKRYTLPSRPSYSSYSGKSLFDSDEWKQAIEEANKNLENL